MEISEILRQNMREYAEQVNEERAIPDARTGLKPIHRKILYEMWKDGIRNEGKYRKCAYMVGQIIARFSEHGDAGTYDALVRLSKDWVHSYPLLDFHGNNGSIYDSGSYAAMRYTEAKLSKLAQDGYLKTLDQDTIDWEPNFTNEEEEPTTLPALFPGLFCLSTEGIGYACACNFLPMNLRDVAKGICEVLGGGEFPILQYDLPTGGIIVNPKDMRKVYERGQGSITVESVYKVDGHTLIVTEIPFGLSVSKFMESVEKSELVSRVRDMSGAGKFQVFIDINRKYDDIQAVIDTLMRTTSLSVSYHINQVALVDGKPRLLTQREMYDVYIKHNMMCIQREHSYKARKAKDRLEILDGYLIAFEHLPEILKLLENDESLHNKFGLTDRQADAIMELRIKRLSGLNQEKVRKEREETSKSLESYIKVRDSENAQRELLSCRLRDLAERYGRERRTRVLTKVRDKEINVVSHKKEFLREIGVFVDSDKKGGESFFTLFSNLGRMYRISVKKDLKSSHTKIGDVIKLGNGEAIIAAFSNEELDGVDLDFISDNGWIKAVPGTDFIGTSRSVKGRVGTKLKDGDELVEVLKANDVLTLQLSDKTEMHLDQKLNVPKMGKNSFGKNLISSTCVVMAATTGPKD